MKRSVKIVIVILLGLILLLGGCTVFFIVGAYEVGGASGTGNENATDSTRIAN